MSIFIVILFIDVIERVLLYNVSADLLNQVVEQILKDALQQMSR